MFIGGRMKIYAIEWKNGKHQIRIYHSHEPKYHVKIEGSKGWITRGRTSETCIEQLIIRIADKDDRTNAILDTIIKHITEDGFEIEAFVLMELVNDIVDIIESYSIPSMDINITQIGGDYPMCSAKIIIYE